MENVTKFLVVYRPFSSVAEAFPRFNRWRKDPGMTYIPEPMWANISSMLYAWEERRKEWGKSERKGGRSEGRRSQARIFKLVSPLDVRTKAFVRSYLFIPNRNVKASRILSKNIRFTKIIPAYLRVCRENHKSPSSVSKSVSNKIRWDWANCQGFFRSKADVMLFSEDHQGK